MIAANVVESDGSLNLNLTKHELETLLFDQQDYEYFAVYDAGGRAVASNSDLQRLAATVPSGAVSDAVVDGEKIRLVTLRSEGALPFTVIVGETTRSRGKLLAGLLQRSIMPQVVLLLLLGGLLWRQITRELTPLGELQRALERRDSSDLDPIAVEPMSSDVSRLRDAVNALLARVSMGVQAQREFAGNVAHDLRTPLAGIRALAEYGLAQADPPVWRRQLEQIVHSEERASRLVDQLLALALADEAQDSVELAPVAVHELVRNLVLSFVARADAAGFELEAEGLDAPVIGLAAPVLLEGVLTNLIDNALRYGHGAAPSPLKVAIECRLQRVRISVTDAGPGLEPEQCEQIRQRWARGPAGVSLGAGVGLGLAIASRYAALMKGTLELNAGPDGRGLCAVLELRQGQLDRSS